MADLGAGPTKVERRSARDHEQPAQPRQLGDEIVGQGLGDHGVRAGVARQAEGQHGDAWPRGGRRLGQLRLRAGGSDRDQGLGRHGRHLRDKAEAQPVNGADHPLLPAVVAQRVAHRFDPAGDSRVRHDPPAPDALDDLVLADHPVVVLDQQTEQREHLRLKRDRAASGRKLDLVGIQLKIFERVDHRANYSSYPGNLRKSSRSSPSVKPPGGVFRSH